MFAAASALILPIAMAAAAGLVGCFAVMRRMTLAADAISHVALPGVGIALAFQINPILGAFVMLMVGTLLIWSIETRTRISTETITGVVFSVALAIGSMITTGEQLVEALFGGPGMLGGWEAAIGFAAACAVIAFILTQRDRLIVALVSPEIAMTCGINVARLDLLYLLTFAVTVALGLRYLGVLLMGSLIIIPAATARRVATSLTTMLAASVTVAIVATVAGTIGATLIHRESGPMIITVAGAIFFASLLTRPRTRAVTS